jgi:hypothetical protein
MAALLHVLQFGSILLEKVEVTSLFPMGEFLSNHPGVQGIIRGCLAMSRLDAHNALEMHLRASVRYGRASVQLWFLVVLGDWLSRCIEEVSRKV